jgi:hypothetical protein
VSRDETFPLLADLAALAAVIVGSAGLGGLLTLRWARRNGGVR